MPALYGFKNNYFSTIKILGKLSVIYFGNYSIKNYSNCLKLMFPFSEIVTPSPPTTSNLQHQSRIVRTPWPRGNGTAGPSTSSNQNQPGTLNLNGSGRQNQRGEKRKMAEGPAVFFQR
jgi:hypothetical protein